MAGEMILVVDDNVLNLKLARILLEGKGYRIQTAADGLEGLKAAAEIRPQLILLDIQLPGIDGLEVARRLKANPETARIPIVALTAYAMKGDEEQARAAGCEGYITKPIDTAKFPAAVRRYLDLHAAPATPPAGRTAMVVDDDPVQRKLLCLEFERAGYHVIPAEDGADALARSENATIDIIVSDVLMPRLDGFRLCRAARQDPRLAKVPIVLITSGSVQHSDEELARTMGASALVVRTPNPSGLFATVSKALAEGAEPASAVAPAELDAIAEEFLVEGARQSGRLASEADSGLNIPSVRRLAHRWAGTGGTLGFPQISQLAFEIERGLEKPGHTGTALADRLKQLADLFQHAMELRRSATAPVWIAGLLPGRRIGLAGFPPPENGRIRKALESAGAVVSQLDDEKSTALRSYEMLVANASARAAIVDLEGSGAPVLFAGSVGILREDPLAGVAIPHDLIVEPWTVEEIVTRCHRLLSGKGMSNRLAAVEVDREQPIQILIADDDPTIIAIVRSTFEGHGMQCRATGRGDNVIALAEERTPDVIVLDVNLPQVDGFQVLSSIRNHATLSRCFVVLLTARQQETDIMKGFGLGADDYIVKPFSPLELAARVRRLLKERSTW